MVKGAGMLAPSLATMLCVITTDAAVDADALDHALRNASARTFDRIDIDGSCSTNDTVLLLASGASEVTPSQDELDAALLAVCNDLCAQLQADAEGVTIHDDWSGFGQRTTASGSGGDAQPRVSLSFSATGVEARIRYPVHLKNAAEIDERISQEVSNVVAGAAPIAGTPA